MFRLDRAGVADPVSGRVVVSRGSALLSVSVLIGIAAAGRPVAGAAERSGSAQAPRIRQAASTAPPARAQEPAPPPATPAASATKPTEPTPEHVAKARQLIFAIGVPDAFEVAVSDAMAQIAAAMTQAHPDVAGDMSIVLDSLRPEFAKQTESMVDVTARFYASEFSEQDIDTILAFFNSEAGRRWNAAQRDIYKQLTSGIQAWQQKVIVTMVARVRQEMKKKGHDL